jgi:hypothetical protein
MDVNIKGLVEGRRLFTRARAGQPAHRPFQKPVLEKLTLKFFKYYEIIHGSSWRAMDNNNRTFANPVCVKHVISRETGPILQLYWPAP